MQLSDVFLNQLFSHSEREIFARITALNFQEKNLEFIEGRITGGSINIDGNSSVRRTCSVNMIAEDININEFYWGLRNKFRLEIGLKNFIDSAYPDIIWFKQGTFIITNFNTTHNVNNYSISISGKDKMCLLNGETITYTNIKIHTILIEMLQNFGNELIQNIVINDLEDKGMDLLEYRGDVPLYLLRKLDSDLIENISINGKVACTFVEDGTSTTIDSLQSYDTLSDLSELKSTGQEVYLNGDTSTKYTIVRLEYGSLAGYRLTDLVYAGDLIANAGETITSVLDKIVNMLGNFEYFYDLDGRFIFQRKRNYINTAWNSLISNDDQIYADAAANSSSYVFNLLNNHLIISFQNTPNLLNLRNDYTVWGKKTSASGAELDIHMRYVIDKKPTIYYSFRHLLNSNGEWDERGQPISYSTDEFDWRELIYQMALDYRKCYHNDNFLIKVAEYNPQYITGKTGYEQYYIDLEGFWRLLYNPEPDEKDVNNYYMIEENKYWNKNVIENPENLIFWFDFLDAETSDLFNYSVPSIGARTKVVNDNNAKNIYYRDIPKIIYSDAQSNTQTGYTTVQLQPTMENLFTISSKGKSCKEAIDELLYKHSYCAENINITAIPLYHLQPNTRILIKDEQSNINGEYIISKITVPLTYNGTMTIAATKAVSNLN